MLLTHPAFLAYLRSHCPDGLVYDAQWTELAEIPGALGRAFASGCLEVRLGEGGGPVDYQLCALARNGGREAVAGAVSRGALRRLAAVYPGWARTEVLLREWTTSGTVLHDHVPSVWLEFDADRGPQPFGFVCLEDRLRGDMPPIREIVSAAIPVMLGDEPGGALAAQLLACIDALPTGSRVHHVAAMPARGQGAARLRVGVPVVGLARWLQDVEWPGQGARAVEAIRALGDYSSRAIVHLDVAGRVLPRLGVEFHYKRSPHEDMRWATLFDGLEAMGLCAESRRTAVSAWTPARKRGPLFGASERGLLVKVDLGPTGPYQAKAYLGAMPQPSLPEYRSRRTIRAPASCQT